MPMERVDHELVEFDVQTDEMLVNMGPQHPSTHGVLRLVLRTDGEVVAEVTPHIGYLHRSRGKDRRECHAAAVDSLHRSHGLPGRDEHESRLGAGGREAAGPGVPEKARHLRVMICELSRIASHLVAAWHLRPGPGQFHAVHLGVSRAGEDSRPVRGALRRPADATATSPSAA